MKTYPYNFKQGQRIQTNVPNKYCDSAYFAHFQVTATEAVAADTDGVLALTNLNATAQTITTGISDPAVPRNATITGNVSGVTGTVTVNGTNYLDETIDEDLTANGTSTVLGAKAFKTVTSIELPIQTHTPAYQTETQAYTHKADAAGTITITVTAAGMTGSPKAVALEVVLDDTAIQVATKVVAALNADDDVSEMYTASNEDGTSATVTLTAVNKLANDSTLAMAFVDTDTTGVTAGASTNGVTGVPYDKISVGWGDKLGLPYLLERNTVVYKQTFLNNVVESTEPAVTVSSTAIESNTIDLNSALNGTAIDVYLIV